ncbi:hypothetical protein NKH77_20395 [Streptomyces sp. M19]
MCDRGTIAGIAGNSGCPPTCWPGGRRPDAARAGLEALLRLSRDGAFGVPFFLHGHEKFWGGPAARVHRLGPRPVGRRRPVRAVRFRFRHRFPLRPRPRSRARARDFGFLAARSGDQGHAGAAADPGPVRTARTARRPAEPPIHPRRMQMPAPRRIPRRPWLTSRAMSAALLPVATVYGARWRTSRSIRGAGNSRPTHGTSACPAGTCGCPSRRASTCTCGCAPAPRTGWW